MFPLLFDEGLLLHHNNTSAVIEIINQIVHILQHSSSQQQQQQNQQQDYVVLSANDIYNHSFQLYHLHYLQYQCSPLFKNNISLFCETFERLMAILQQNRNHQNNAFVDSHIITCIGSMMIELDVIQKDQSTFQSFVSHLLTCVSSQSSQNRMIRQMCCECLYELECQYPGLLSSYVFHLLRLCQNESSHILQSYTTLLMIVLDNWIQKMLMLYHQQQPTAIMTTAVSSGGNRFAVNNDFYVNHQHYSTGVGNDGHGIAIKFVIPSVMQSYGSSNMMSSLSSNITVPYLLPDLKKEVHQCLSFVVENCALFSVWGETTILEHLFRIVPFTEFPIHVIRNCFKGEIYGMNPLQFHYFYRVLKHFNSTNMEVNVNDESVLLMKLTWMMRDYSMPSHFRTLAVHWMISLLRTVHAQNSSFLQQYYRQFFPMSLDDLILKEAKLKCITASYSNNVTASKGSGTLQKGDNLLDVLVCLNDYFFFKELRGQNRRVDIIFDFLFRLLQKQPAYYNRIYHYMVQMIDREVEAQSVNRKIQSFILENVIHFIDKYEEFAKSVADPEQYLTITKSFLSSLESRLCMLSSRSQSIHYYFPLIQRIAEDPFIDPFNLLTYLYQYMRQEHICQAGDWEVGDEILKTCRLAMVNISIRDSDKSTHAAYDPLINLLHVLSKNYENVDIKDRANIYYRLFTTLQGEKLAFILQDILSLDENERAAQYRDTMRMLRTKSAINKPSNQIQRILPFLYLERIGTNDVADTQQKEAIHRKQECSAETIADIVRSHYVHLVKMNKLLKLTHGNNINESLLPESNIPSEQSAISAVKIELQFKLRYATREEVNKQKVQSREELGDPMMPSAKVYGLTMSFSGAQTHHLTNIKPVRVPFLSPPIAQNATSLSEHVFTLHFYPTRPLPGVFQVNAQFTASNSAQSNRDESVDHFGNNHIDTGVLCVTQLNNLNINFKDLFLPLPLTDLLRQKYSHQCLEEILFDAMWTMKATDILLETRQRRRKIPTNSSTNSLRSPKHKNVKSTEWTESVRVMHKDWNFKDNCPTLAPFIVPSKPECAIVFLPPKYHLLLWCQPITEQDESVSTQIRIRTDYGLALSFVDSIFETADKIDR